MGNKQQIVLISTVLENNVGVSIYTHKVDYRKDLKDC
jgi:hypothetical protein